MPSLRVRKMMRAPSPLARPATQHQADGRVGSMGALCDVYGGADSLGRVPADLQFPVQGWWHGMWQDVRWLTHRSAAMERWLVMAQPVANPQIPTVPSIEMGTDVNVVTSPQQTFTSLL
jgi:hypothetical protein